MIKLIINISLDLLPYVNAELNENLNCFLLTKTNSNILKCREVIKNINHIENQRIIKSNKQIVEFTLDFEAINNAKTLAYIFKVEVVTIYDCICRSLVGL